MAIRYDFQELFIKYIIERVHVMYTRQLELCIMNKFADFDEESAKASIRAAQRHGIVLLTKDGLAITKGAYLMATGDRFYDNLDYSSEERAPSGISLQSLMANKNRINSLWVVADMMPVSQDFMFHTRNWDLQFIVPATKDKPSRLFQVQTVPLADVTPFTLALKEYPIIDDRECKEQIRRIILLESEAKADRIPYLGVKFIGLLDENDPKGFRIIRERSDEEMWKDLRP